jgi:hypothetical protein
MQKSPEIKINTIEDITELEVALPTPSASHFVLNPL